MAMRGRTLEAGIVVSMIAGALSLASDGTATLAAAPDAAPTSASTPDSSEQLVRGEYLAHAADCVACHSTPGGAAYAGGRGMGSPLGTIYATNITPDKATGIGEYTRQNFERALRHGIARDGHRLYPSMPYPSYAKLTDEDVGALYAYFMQAVKPVSQPNRPTAIRWPLNMRWPLAIWDYFFVDDGVYRADSAHDAAWNRGAYLVESLGHCGACHTPRGWFFQEEALTQMKSAYLSGASLDNWSALDLTGDAAFGLGSWSEDDITAYLKTGHNAVGAAFGSMIDAINYSTQFLTREDDAAMAHYLKSLPAAHGTTTAWKYDDASAQALTAGKSEAPGARDYVQLCAGCHQRDGRGSPPFIPALAGNPAVLDTNPVSLINITLNGSVPVVAGGTPDAYRMVSFRTVLNDRQLADVVSFIRGAWGNAAAPVKDADVAGLRAKTDPVRYEELDLLRMR
jgi:mono/diheme cytochrome c family protein